MAFKVGDVYRTNDLSLKPGGCTIFVIDERGNVLEYDKVKNPEAYIRKLKRENLGIQKVWWE